MRILGLAVIFLFVGCLQTNRVSLSNQSASSDGSSVKDNITSLPSDTFHIGNAKVGDTTSTKTITFANLGGTGKACSLSLSAGDTSIFTIVSTTCTSTHLAGYGSSCVAVISATPVDNTSYSATLKRSCSGSSKSVRLTALGTNADLAITGMKINDDDLYSTSADVTVDISYFGTADEICLQTSSSVSSCTYTSFTSGNDISYTFSGTGLQTLYAWLRLSTNTSNVSAVYSDSIIIDNTAPVLNSVSLNSGIPYATTLSVSVSYSVTESSVIKSYCALEATGDVSTCSWQTATTNPFTYSFSSSGYNTLYLWVKDIADNVSNVVSDDVTIDTSVTTNGTTGSDTVTGTSVNDIIYAGEGGDTISGGAGDDILYGDGKQFDCREIAGCILWLDAADTGTITNGTGTTVSIWKDKSGLSNSAFQVTAARKPDRSASATIGNRKAILFDGSDDVLVVTQRDSLAALHKGSHHLFIVAKGTNATTDSKVMLFGTVDATTSDIGFNLILDDSNAGAPENVLDMSIMNGSSSASYLNISSVDNAFTPTNESIIETKFDLSSTASEILVNGTSLASSSSVTGLPNGNPSTYGLGIGGFYENSQFYGGNIAEILAFEKELSGTDLTLVYRYLYFKYGISISGYTFNVTADVITGGDGSDYFSFGNMTYTGTTAGTRDRITDFSQSDGDKIVLSGMSEVFTSVGMAAFNGTGASEIRWYASGPDTIIEMDYNGDGVSDGEIQLDNFTAASLTDSDFILTDATAASLVISKFPAEGYIGGQYGFKVTAFDHFGRVATGYTGTINISNTDPSGTLLESDYTFLSTNQGESDLWGFYIPGSAGTFTITVTDASNNLLTATSNTITIGSQLTVAPLYPSNGANWNDYVLNDNLTTSIFDNNDVACTGSGLDDWAMCQHGGELRKVVVTGAKTCEGLYAYDDLEVFEWECQILSSVPTFVSTGFQKGKGLRDLVNASSWKSNKVIISGLVEAETAMTTWWSNTVTPLSNSTLSLTSSGTIYTLDESADTDGYEINADKIGVVTLGTSVLSYSGSATNNCQNLTMKCVLNATGDNYLWIETKIDAYNATTTAARIVDINNGYFIRVHESEFKNASTEGLYLENTPSSSITNIKVGYIPSGNGSIYLTNCSGSRIDNTYLFQSYRGITVTNSDNIKIRNSFIYSASWNNFVINNDVTYDGVIQNSVVAGTSFGHYQMNSAREFNLINGSTMNGGPTFQLDNYGDSPLNLTTLNNQAENSTRFGIVQSANATGFLDSPTFVNNVASNNSNANFIEENRVLDTKYSGIQGYGGGINTCTIGDSTNGGIADTTCALQNNSDGTLFSTTIDTSGSFVGSILNDSINPNSSYFNATGDFPTDYLTFDFLNFQSPFRGFQREDKNSCKSGQSCIVYDYRIHASDDVLLNRSGDGLTENEAFVKNATCPAEVHGNRVATDQKQYTSTNTFLLNATEILFDYIGDDDGLCESNEACLYTPNVGAYQGDGDYRNNKCVFQDGTVSGVTMYAHPSNGYWSFDHIKQIGAVSGAGGAGRDDRGYGVHVSKKTGDIFVGGMTYGNWADTNGTTPAYQFDPAAAKFDYSGKLKWKAQLGASFTQGNTTNEDDIASTALDRNDNLLMSGWSWRALFGPYFGSQDAHVMKFSSEGDFVWGVTFGKHNFGAGTNTTDRSQGLGVDRGNNVYVALYTSGSIADSYGGVLDAIVTKLSPNGKIIWVRQTGATFGSRYSINANTSHGTRNLTVDKDGNPIVLIRVAGNLKETLGGGADVGLIKFSTQGEVLWSRHFGEETLGASRASGTDEPLGITTDYENNIYVAGVTSGSLGETNGGSYDLFVMKVNSQGNIVWIKQLGANQGSYGSGDFSGNENHNYDINRICYNSVNGDIYAVGRTTGNMLETRAGSADVFVVRMAASDGTIKKIKHLGQTTMNGGETATANYLSITAGPEGDIYVGGGINGTYGEATGTNNDFFLMKLNADLSINPY